MSGLVHELELRGSAISEAVIAAMYEDDPFWEARFGPRGRRNADEDGRWHLRYLLEALRSEDPGVMERYARWLQPLLTSRGMCTLHIDDNFARLAAAIAREIPGADAAVDCLARARAALAYEDGPGAEVQRAGPALAADVAAGLGSDRPRLDHDLRHLVSHLADALHLHRGELFRDHLRFAARFLPAGELARVLPLLRGALLRRAPGAVEAAAPLLETPEEGA